MVFPLVEGTLKTSNLMEDIQALKDKQILIKDMIAIRCQDIDNGVVMNFKAGSVKFFELSRAFRDLEQG